MATPTATAAHGAGSPDRGWRSTTRRRGLAVILALVVVVLVYGVGIEPRFMLSADRETAVLPHLPVAWSGQRVAVLGDFHIGMWLGNSDMAQRAVQQAVAARPAAVFLLGDFIAEPGGVGRDNLDTLTRLLRPLTHAHLPTFAVLGNHDDGVPGAGTRVQPQVVARVRQTLARLGIQVLQNRAVVLAPPHGPLPVQRRAKAGLYVVGLGPHDAALDRPQEALRGVPRAAPRIVLMHDPASFPALPAGSAPLALAAHTHCGQVRVPLVTRWLLALAEGHRVAADGWNGPSADGGNRLYVTCGIGMSVVPLRINDPPQVTIVTLRRR